MAGKRWYQHADCLRTALDQVAGGEIRRIAEPLDGFLDVPAGLVVDVARAAENPGNCPNSNVRLSGDISNSDLVAFQTSDPLEPGDL